MRNSATKETSSKRHQRYKAISRKSREGESDSGSLASLSDRTSRKQKEKGRTSMERQRRRFSGDAASLETGGSSDRRPSPGDRIPPLQMLGGTRHSQRVISVTCTMGRSKDRIPSQNLCPNGIQEEERLQTEYRRGRVRPTTATCERDKPAHSPTTQSWVGTTKRTQPQLRGITDLVCRQRQRRHRSCRRASASTEARAWLRAAYPLIQAQRRVSTEKPQHLYWSRRTGSSVSALREWRI